MWFLRFEWAQWAKLEPKGPAGLPADGLFRSEDGLEACAYWPPQEHNLASQVALVLQTQLVRLEPSLALPGAAAGQRARWHYIVATDVLPQQEADFNAWYEQEHLPGLAAVPGVVRAARYLVASGPAPRYHACYDLAERAAFNGPAWLAVRETAWSSKVRPAFRNTLRVMYQRWPTS